MPIFIDRHDMRGMTQLHVAKARSRDLEVQGRYSVKYVAYRFDEERCAGCCLVHAPDPATAEQVHREAHGQIANAMIPVHQATVEAFLGRIGDPRASGRVHMQGANRYYAHR